MSFQARLKRLFGSDALDWLDRSYVIDWAVVIGIWVLSWIASNAPVFERDFSPQDPIISHPYKPNQVSSTLNHRVALYIPIFIAVAVGGLRRSLIEIHHSIISVSAARGLARLVTVLMKHAVGRLRPDFLARCQWNEILQSCTGTARAVLDGRKSFPSGHSSTAFSGMMFLSLWIAGKTAAWCFHVPLPAASIRSSRMGSLSLTLLPLFWASFVAISRIEDYRHHKEDVVVGSLIGIISSFLCYLIFWPSPFSAKNFIQPLSGRPRNLYDADQHQHEGPRNINFELTALEDEIDHV